MSSPAVLVVPFVIRGGAMPPLSSLPSLLHRWLLSAGVILAPLKYGIVSPLTLTGHILAAAASPGNRQPLTMMKRVLVPWSAMSFLQYVVLLVILLYVTPLHRPLRLLRAQVQPTPQPKNVVALWTPPEIQLKLVKHIFGRQRVIQRCLASRTEVAKTHAT